MAAHLLDDPWVGEGERAAQWVGLSDWQYRTVVTLDAAMLARRDVDLVFDGLDTFAHVRINGVSVLAADNMFRTWRVAARALLKPGANSIEIDFASPIKKLLPMVMAQKFRCPAPMIPRSATSPRGRQTANHVRKAAYHYGWDFTPRIVTIGIAKPVRIEAYDGPSGSPISNSRRCISTTASRCWTRRSRSTPRPRGPSTSASRSPRPAERRRRSTAG